VSEIPLIIGEGIVVRVLRDLNPEVLKLQSTKWRTGNL
jgi:hypothetical protein